MAHITRREALKRGATVGAGVIWATPVIQTVGMQAAFAQSVSPTDQVYFAAKIEEGVCEDIWDQIGQDTDPGAPTGKCLTPSSGGFGVGPGACDHVVGFTTPEEPEPWTITLLDGCEIIEEDCFVLTKASNDCLKDPAVREGQTWIFANPASNGNGISHIEFVICCDSIT